jgi:hypothetical protein
VVDAAPANFFPVGGFLPLPAPTVAAVAEASPAVVSELTPDVETQTVFAVRKKADDSVVAEGLGFEDAKALVAKAAAAKKAKLYFV